MKKTKEELKKYKKGDKLKVKILEIKVDQQKVRVDLNKQKMILSTGLKIKK